MQVSTEQSIVTARTPTWEEWEAQWKQKFEEGYDGIKRCNRRLEKLRKQRPEIWKNTSVMCLIPGVTWVIVKCVTWVIVKLFGYEFYCGVELMMRHGGAGHPQQHDAIHSQLFHPQEANTQSLLMGLLPLWISLLLFGLLHLTYNITLAAKERAEAVVLDERRKLHTIFLPYYNFEPAWVSVQKIRQEWVERMKKEGVK